MDRIVAILGYQWSAYWRRVQRAGNLTTNNAGLWLLFGGLGIVKYLQQLPGVAVQLARGDTTRYETLLLAVFLVGMLPMMGESRRSISSRDLLHTPLTYRDLYLIRVGSILISPVTWIIAICSLTLGYPIARAAHPGAGIVALLLFLLLSLATGLTIAHVLNSALIRKVLMGALVVSSAVLWVTWMAKGRVLTSGFVWWPTRLAADAAVGSNPFASLTALAAMMVAAFGLSFWTFIGSLQPGRNRRSQILPGFGLMEFPGRLGGLVKKDLKYFTRLLDLYLALPIVILFCMYLTSAPDPSASAFRVVLVALFLPGLSMPGNCFGLDSPLGLDRYALFPLSGRDVLFSKNLAFAVIFIVLFGAIFPLAVWRFGPGIAALGFIELVLIGLAYSSWGNWMSVRTPHRMQFYRFSSSGSLGDALIGMFFGSLPGVLMVFLLLPGNEGVLWKIALLLILYIALYYLSTTWTGRRHEERREDIRRVLS